MKDHTLSSCTQTVHCYAQQQRPRAAPTNHCFNCVFKFKMKRLFLMSRVYLLHEWKPRGRNKQRCSQVQTRSVSRELMQEFVWCKRQGWSPRALDVSVRRSKLFSIMKEPALNKFKIMIQTQNISANRWERTTNRDRTSRQQTKALQRHTRRPPGHVNNDKTTQKDHKNREDRRLCSLCS